ncbi:MAG: ceramide glucosyltransferase [Planctomycetes bacterium]|nr:ceramide glucosyltransferase [Planctomycetota bacterium]
MATTIFVVLIGIGLCTLILSRIGLLLTLRRKLHTPPAGFPAITVLKPMKGVDPSLEDNLRSFFKQAYPNYQLVLGSPDFADSANDVARKVAAEFPHIDAIVAPGSLALGYNPKVCSLANLYQHARHDLILVSDSNIRAPENYLANLAHHMERPNAGLVTSPFRGVDAKDLGGTLEQLHLNTFVVGGMCALNEVMRYHCVIGKSMMMRRADLDAFGGFEFLSRYLGEDQVSGEEIARLGKRVVVADVVIDNVLGSPGVKGFLARQVRWATIRRHIALPGYIGEFLLNPMAVALIGMLVLWNLPMLYAFLGVIVLKSLVDASFERALGVRRALWCYPMLILLKDLLLAVFWFKPFLNSTIQWRGDRVRVARRSLLVAAGERA